MVSGHSELAGLLTSWLPRQRWFASKGRPLAGVSVISDVRISALLRHLIVRVDFSDGGPPDSYQVPLAVRTEAPYGHDGFLLGESGDGLVYDGLHDPEGAADFLRFLRAGSPHGGLTPHVLDEVEDLPAHAAGAEQSNTSVVYGESYILKVFRRLWPGQNPDIEVTRALADGGSEHVARPLGWVDGRLGDEVTSLALLQEYLRSGTEGWRLATASVRDLYAEADLHPDEVGGDFAGESERLGTATAEVHDLLARVLPSRPGDPETLAATAARMQARLDAATAVVEGLRPFETALRTTYDALAGQARDAAAHPAAAPRLQRVHGDYHLGQVLRVDSGWVLFDFEGEPARPVSERVELVPPLVDVAGMLRSFDYAARSLLLERADEPGLVYRAQEWADRNRDAFCAGYAAAAGHDPRAEGVLLRAYELDKAVYEVVYEARHRPAWLPIPLGSIERLASQTV